MSRPVLYPINLKLSQRKCVVVGGGEVAARKIGDLLDAGAKVIVIAPKISEAITNHTPAVEIFERQYQSGDVKGAFLVFAATDNSEINQAVATQAVEAGALVNVADDPEGCDFFVPSKVNRGDLQITVSTSGNTPVITKRLRMELEDTYGPDYGTWIELVKEARDELLTRKDLETKKRGEILRKLLDLPLLALIREGKTEEAKQEVARCIWQS